MGVTGVRGEIATGLTAIISGIRKYTDVPIAVGFGVSTPEQAKYYCGVADGVIVGSAIVRIIGENRENAKQALYEYIKEMKQSC